MKIILNGQAQDVAPGMSVKTLIEKSCRNSRHVIAELNGEIVKRERWDEQKIKDNDALELVTLVGGG